MTDYELMVIFTPVLSEEEFKSAQNNVVDFLKENGGTPVHSNPWGLRSLAFSIHKKTTGLYWVLEYQAPNDLNEKLKIQLNRDETVLRHLITALDKYAVAYNLKKRANTKSEEPNSRTGSPKPVEA